MIDIGQVIELNPVADEKAVIKGDNYRFTVLTDRLIRVEYQENGDFLDEATKLAICRKFDLPKFSSETNRGILKIDTEALTVYFDPKKGLKSLQIKLKNPVEGLDVYNFGTEVENLQGTARTLDNVDGSTTLDKGIMSKKGLAVIDDSKSVVIKSDGWVEARKTCEEDYYIFAYGHDYIKCLQDFYRLSGSAPLLPRYTLGNWWSRFYPYDEAGYIKLMKEFEEKDIPISVSVIDMDWHKTQVPEKYGSGWTGYSWNKDLFPDPKRFLKTLHKMGKHITLNLHPADGVRGFEDAYPEMAKALGVNAEEEEPIEFNVNDRKFMDAYFKYLHHPMEKDGVDFWWVDWQQGEKSSVEGIDPLFMLNHFHFIDSGRDGKLPLTFSRYAGIGSHRYPLGFSGDTMSTWKSLDFQPYFTTNASNVGYSWWSHDIGGHQKGRRDDEMVARWVQYGTFSPIMRLHSTANAFYGKEPWNYNLIVENTISDFMRLRHKLVPYLHTMNYRNHLEGRPLVESMYYRHDRAEAYKNKNQYYFGDLIVCPITEQNDAETWLGSSKAWIPEGTYVDVFNGLEYRGPKEIKLFRDITTMPVLAKKGSIIPMAKDLKNVCVNNPKVLDVHVFAGENGNFDLYEDDCSEMQKMPLAVTKFTLKSKKDITLEVKPTGDISVIPEDRTYNFIFHNMKQGEKISVITENGKETDEYNLNYDESGKKFTISYKDKGNQGFKLTIFGGGALHDLPDKITLINKLLNRAQIEYDIKEKCQWILREEPIPEEALRKMERIGAKANITEAVEDILLSDAL